MIVFRPRRKLTFFSHGRVQTPRRTLVPRYLFAVVAILICSSVEFFFPFHVEAELLNNSFNFRNGLFESGIIFSAPSVSARIESFQFSENLTPESSSGLVEFFDIPVFFGSTLGEPVVNESPSKIPEGSASGENSNIVKTYWHPGSLLLGFSAGAWLAIFICDIYPRIRSF